MRQNGFGRLVLHKPRRIRNVGAVYRHLRRAEGLLQAPRSCLQGLFRTVCSESCAKLPEESSCVPAVMLEGSLPYQAERARGALDVANMDGIRRRFWASGHEGKQNTIESGRRCACRMD